LASATRVLSINVFPFSEALVSILERALIFWSIGSDSISPFPFLPAITFPASPGELCFDSSNSTCGVCWCMPLAALVLSFSPTSAILLVVFFNLLLDLF
jgi:hypothetical protein